MQDRPGLVAANLLGQAGITALLIEQNPGLSALPKALMVDDEFFRLLQTSDWAMRCERTVCIRSVTIISRHSVHA